MDEVKVESLQRQILEYALDELAPNLKMVHERLEHNQGPIKGEANSAIALLELVDFITRTPVSQRRDLPQTNLANLVRNAFQVVSRTSLRVQDELIRDT